MVVDVGCRLIRKQTTVMTRHKIIIYSSASRAWCFTKSSDLTAWVHLCKRKFQNQRCFLLQHRQQQPSPYSEDFGMTTFLWFFACSCLFYYTHGTSPDTGYTYPSKTIATLHLVLAASWSLCLLLQSSLTDHLSPVADGFVWQETRRLSWKSQTAYSDIREQAVRWIGFFLGGKLKKRKRSCSTSAKK